MTTRYAYINIENNDTLWGPGPLPYFISLRDGTLWEVSAHTVAESEEKGIFIVEQIDKRDFDTRFEVQNLPTYKVNKQGRPVETYTYSFVAAARENMLNGIDELAESIRSRIATKFPGQYEEYNQVYLEALAVKALPADSVIEPGTYRLLEADVGITYSPILERNVENVREAADLVIYTRDVWMDLTAAIREQRLKAKKEIREAATDTIAYHLYKQYVSTQLELQTYTDL